MDVKDIVVVVPIYLPTLSATDAIALKQCLKVLSRYDIVVIKPRSLDIAQIALEYGLKRIAEFPDECFSSLRGYNKLVLSEEFYRFFKDYSYMLIYQLDAYVFKDELLLWAEKGYDYIGAPWIPMREKYLSAGKRLSLSIRRNFWKWFDRKKLHLYRYHYYQVGNGGFSLRRIDKMLQITACYREVIDRELADDKPFLPEDLFLYADLNKRGYQLKRPPYRIAMKFSMELSPWWTFRKNNYQLPFGCHNWMHEQTYPFWSEFIK